MSNLTRADIIDSIEDTYGLLCENLTDREVAIIGHIANNIREDEVKLLEKANEFDASKEQALHKHVVRHSCDMISDEYVYKKHFRFQQMLKDGKWYVTYNNFIITHGQYRHDLEQWIDSNYV